MKDATKKTKKVSRDEISLSITRKSLNNKKIYFDSEGTEVRIGYDEEVGVGFVEIVSE